MQGLKYFQNRCLLLNNIVSLRSTFFASQVQEKNVNKSILSSNLQNSLNKKSLEFNKHTITEDFGLFSSEADVYDTTTGILDIPTQPRTLDFYSSLNFYNEAEKQYIDISAFLDDVVNIEDIENFIENLDKKVEITLDGERIQNFNVERMKKFVYTNDYENIVNELNNRKWPKFSANKVLLNEVLEIVVENASCDEIKKVIDDFSKSDCMAYIENSTALSFFTKILKEYDLKTVINQAETLKDLFLIDEMSKVCSRKMINEIEKKSNEKVQILLNTAFEMNYSLSEIEKLWRIFLSKGYTTNKSIYFELAISQLLEKREVDLALTYWKRQHLEFLESTCFHYFLKYFVKNKIPLKGKLYNKIFQMEFKMARSMDIYADIIVCFVEMDQISEAKELANKMSLKPLQFKKPLKRIKNVEVYEVLTQIIKDGNKKKDSTLLNRKK